MVNHKIIAYNRTNTSAPPFLWMDGMFVRSPVNILHMIANQVGKILHNLKKGNYVYKLTSCARLRKILSSWFLKPTKSAR